MYYTEDDGTRVMIKAHASSYVPDTENTLRFKPTESGELHLITARSRMLPGLNYWSRPPARLMRAWVDELISGTEFKRVGRCEYSTGGSLTVWFTTYYVRIVKKETPCQ